MMVQAMRQIEQWGRELEARKLLTQIFHGDLQPCFRSLNTQVRQKLKNNDLSTLAR